MVGILQNSTELINNEVSIDSNYFQGGLLPKLNSPLQVGIYIYFNNKTTIKNNIFSNLKHAIELNSTAGEISANYNSFLEIKSAALYLNKTDVVTLNLKNNSYCNELQDVVLVSDQ